jgi:hypothetical protein
VVNINIRHSVRFSEMTEMTCYYWVLVCFRTRVNVKAMFMVIVKDSYCMRIFVMFSFML